MDKMKVKPVIITVGLLSLVYIVIGYFFNGVPHEYTNIAGRNHRRDVSISNAYQNGSILQPAAETDVKYNYFVQNDDPNAALYLNLALEAFTKKSMSTKLGLKLDTKGSIKWPTTTSVKEKWAIAIDAMRELEYEQRLPDVVGIGIMKSGTSALKAFLSIHPQIVSLPFEAQYFNDHYSKGIEYYRARMGFSRSNQLTFEKSPAFFVLENGPKLIKKDLPGHVKFLVCVRDPVERLISQFRHHMRRDIYQLQLIRDETKMKEAMAETAVSQGRRLANILFDSNGQIKSSVFVEHSTYSTSFKKWLEYFPRDRFLIVKYERINDNLYAELNRIETFLGLAPFYAEEMFYYDENIHHPCMHGYSCPKGPTEGFDVPKAQLSPAQIQKLRDYFRPYNREFEQLTKMEFPWTHL